MPTQIEKQVRLEADLKFHDHGSFWLMFATSDAGNEWVSDSIPNACHLLGDAIAIEPRYVCDIARGAIADGLTVERI